MSMEIRTVDIEKRATIRDLPDSLMIEIFSFLSQEEVLELQLVSKRWFELSKDRYLWRFCNLSSHDKGFYKSVLKSGIIENLRSLKIARSSVQQEVILAVLGNPDLVALCLKQSTIIKPVNVDINFSGVFSINAIKSNLKLLDLREVSGDLKVLHENVLYHGDSLESLGLSGTTPLLIQKKLMSGMPFLRILDCSECSWFNDRIILHLSTSCPNLQSLSAMRCVHVSGIYLQQLVEGCRELKALNLRRTRLSDSEISRVQWNTSKIEELDVSHCYALDEEGLKQIIPKLRHLRYLRSAVTDAVMAAMTTVAPKIEVFELRRRYPVATENICLLLCLCCNMTCLDISLTPVEAKYFYDFLPNMPKLQTILFAGHQVLGTAEIVRALRNTCKDIRSIGINYYHAGEDGHLKEALISMTIRSPKLETVALQGLYVDELVKELQLLAEHNTVGKKVSFISPIKIEFPSMEHGLDCELKKYKRMY